MIPLLYIGLLSTCVSVCCHPVIATGGKSLDQRNLSFFYALFNEALLRSHGLLDKEIFVDVLQYENDVSVFDSRPAVHINCVDYAVNSKEAPLRKESHIVFVDNNSSTVCFVNESMISDKEFISKGLTTIVPPSLKIDKSVVDFLSINQPLSTNSLQSSSIPEQHEKFQEMNDRKSYSLFIDLLPADSNAEKTISVLTDILMLSPIMHRYRLVKNCPESENNTTEWHYLLLKAITKNIKSNSTPLNTQASVKDSEYIAGSDWTKLLAGVLSLCTSTPLSHALNDNLDSIVSDWIHEFEAHKCPILRDIRYSLLELDSGKPRFQRVQLQENTVRLFLSTPIDGNQNVFSRECLVHLVHAASVHPSVVGIALGIDYHFANFNAAAISQSGTAFMKPYTAAGLTGKDQICGVADTGLDDTSCFFRDNYPTIMDLIERKHTINNSNPYELGGAKFRSPTTKRSYLVEHERRKVIQYVPYADTTDAKGGHGTHVCGTIAGQSMPFLGSKKSNTKYLSGDTPLKSMNGVAPESKIAFFDIAYGFGGINLPRLQNNLFPTQYHAGARVSSNSWSGGSAFYGQLSFEVDSYLYHNPDFLILLASGNKGMMKMSFITSPANAKNSICVGASQMRKLYSDAFFSPSEHTASQFNSIGPTSDGRNKPDILAPGYYLMSAYASSVTDQLKAQHIQYGKTVGERVQRWENFTSRGPRCAVHEKSGSSMATPVVAGSALLIREYFMTPTFWLATTCHQYKTKNGMCSRNMAFEPSGYLTKGVLLHSTQAVPIIGDKKIFDLMGGPKPTSSYQCGIINTRESRNQHCNFLPNNVQGYGEIDLERSLPLPSSDTNSTLSPNIQMTVFDKLTISEFQTLKLKVEISSRKQNSLEKERGFLKVTICWYDPPSVGMWSSTLLVHDIDLVIIGPYQKNSKRNNKTVHNNLQQHCGNNVIGGDHKNPNEQIIIYFSSEELIESTLIYDVYLVAHAFPFSRQVENPDGSFTTRSFGEQNVAVVITTNTHIEEAIEFESSSFRPDAGACFSPVNEIIVNDEICEKIRDFEELAEGEKVASDKLSSANREKQPSRPHFAQEVSFSNVKLGIHAKTEGGEVVFGDFVNDISILGTFLPPSNSALVGVSICLDSPHVDVRDLPASAEYPIPRRPGVDAYLFAVTIKPPRGEAIQLGGFDLSIVEGNFYRHFWPYLWMSPNFNAKIDIDEYYAYCNNTSEARQVQREGAFAAYRDVSLAGLRVHNGKDTGLVNESCVSLDEAKTLPWVVSVAYGIQPYGYTPVVAYSGSLRFYFNKIVQNSSMPTDVAPFFPANPPHPSPLNFSTSQRIFRGIVLFLCGLLLVSVFLRCSKLLEANDSLATHENGFVDHRTPLSRQALPSVSNFYGHRNFPLQYNENRHLKSHKPCNEYTSNEFYPDKYSHDEIQGLLSAESYRYGTAYNGRP